MTRRRRGFGLRRDTGGRVEPPGGGCLPPPGPSPGDIYEQMKGGLRLMGGAALCLAGIGDLRQGGDITFHRLARFLQDTCIAQRL